ncbi:toxin glutamine deamidase domain-containing protein [Micromonospora avicenniae]|uniref:Papain fold toxin 1, glutamine deamidase n=1 Tax=Micromonospora avicenniae TaxID=1198245 RepID=A0A1N7AN98_9ACTN|nr:toxin glutamine deamidase domain-containing protein [Micromonospora avicenniae]SIR40620.1 Papain fold toxin 1, glutamine deamidase [Micromonospora avicenniae]
MTLLPSPVPHPLDYAPWDLPGWIHEALDWVVGVEWPEGNERAVWDLADQWYAVAGALAAPRADAIQAAAEVQSGYGAVGAVPEAFEAAWRRLAEGDEAPLPVLLVVSSDLGRMVEECGCDIEAAKLEVWIELGILVVELLSLAVAAVLTAGAASPAAGAAIAASRVIVQQIFKRLAGQLARKSLRHGLKEAGERAARQVAEGGVRGLARRSALGGLAEAGEEAGISLATQAYQNSTGRRDGLDLTDLGASALGGLAGGAAAPLAGLGRHATGHGARIGEQFAREMAGEVIAENAAGLATGAGPTSLEDAARAAVSGGTGAATARADAALQARLDGRLDALASMDLGLPPDPGLPGPTEPVPPTAPRPPTDEASAPVTLAEAVSTGVAVHPPTASTPPVEPGPPQSFAVAAQPSVPGTNAGIPTSSAQPVLPVQPSTVVAQPPVTATLTDSPTLSTAGTASPPMTAGPPSLSGSAGIATATAGSTATAPPATSPIGSAAVATAPGPTASISTGWPAQPATPTPVLPTPTPAEPAAPAPPPVASAPATRVPEPVPGHRSTVPSVDGGGPPPRRPAVGGSWTPDQPLPPDPRPPADGSPGPVGMQGPRPTTPEWYAAAWAADRDAFELRRHRGHFEHQRRTHEENRRRDRAAERRRDAERTYDEIRWLISEGRELAQAGRHATAERYFAEARDRERWYHQQWDLAEEILAGTVASPRIGVDEENFQRINDDVGDLATGAVETSDRSALTGDRQPPPIDRSRRYGRPGGLRPPLALHQTDVERRVPRQPDGRVTRTPDPRQGDWFRLLNDGGPAADPTRGINCVDCTLSLFDTWVHGRPRVSAPRTFDAYAEGDVNRPLDGELNGPRRVEQVTGGRFQRLCEPGDDMPPAQRRYAIDRGYRNLRDQLVLGGHGSYAFVINTWEGGGSHISVALNQNGTVLYLDPQTGGIATRPLYPHTGTPNRYNSINLEVLVLGSDARPMPMGGLARGRQSVLPDLPEYPPAEHDEGYGQPYLNRLHVLAGPGSAAAERAPVTDVITGASDLDSALQAGVPPPDLAAALDAPTLRRLVPHLSDADAGDVAAFFADPRARALLDGAWRDAPPDEPLLAEALIRQMAERPDLARMILATPELFDSLTSRPLTLHHLASHQQAIDVLGDVLAEISERGAETVAARDVPPPPRPTALTPRQLKVSQRLRARRQESIQAGFDVARCHDDQFRSDYLRRLYDEAAAAQLELNAMVVRLAGDRGQPGWRRAPKAHRRVLDKLVEYDNDASRLTDLAAAKLEFRRLDDLYDALHELSRDPDVVVLEIKDRFVRPPSSGYRDVLLKLRMSNGHVAELRLHLVALEGVAEWEHALYEIRRDLDAIAGAAGRPLTLTERAVRDGLLRRGQDAYWRALGNDRGGVSEG